MLRKLHINPSRFGVNPRGDVGAYLCCVSSRTSAASYVIFLFWGGISVSVKYTYDTCISIIRIQMKYQDRSQNWDFSYPYRMLVRIQDFRENPDEIRIVGQSASIKPALVSQISRLWIPYDPEFFLAFFSQLQMLHLKLWWSYFI